MDWFVLDIKKREREQIDLASVFNIHLLVEYSEYVHVFTDGAKQPETGVTGFGVAVPSKRIEVNRRTSDSLSVYTVEMLGVLVALKWVESSTVEKIDLYRFSISFGKYEVVLLK